MLIRFDNTSFQWDSIQSRLKSWVLNEVCSTCQNELLFTNRIGCWSKCFVEILKIQSHSLKVFWLEVTLKLSIFNLMSSSYSSSCISFSINSGTHYNLTTWESLFVVRKIGRKSFMISNLHKSQICCLCNYLLLFFTSMLKY